MKKILALLVVLAATVSGALATITVPAAIEALGAGNTITYGEYSTGRIVVEDAFTPQSLGSSLTFSANGASADVDQTVATAIKGVSTGIDRQILTQGAAASVTQAPGLKTDSENDAKATTLLMTLAKEQNAIYSGKLTAGDVKGTLHEAKDWNGDGVNDDYYGGSHNVLWYTYAQDGPAFVTTFNDNAVVTSTVDKDVVSLKQKVVDAKVTVSAEKDLSVPALEQIYRHSPDCIQGPNEFWQGYATAGNYYPTPTTTQHKLSITGWPEAPEGSTAQLTEVAAGMSSTASLKQSELMVLGNIIELPTTFDGDASLSGAFQNAILDAGQPVNIDLDGDIDIWWE